MNKTVRETEPRPLRFSVERPTDPGAFGEEYKPAPIKLYVRLWRWIRGAYLVAALLAGVSPALAQNIGWPSNMLYHPPILTERERALAECFRDMPWVAPWGWLETCVVRHLDDKRTVSPAGHQR